MNEIHELLIVWSNFKPLSFNQFCIDELVRLSRSLIFLLSWSRLSSHSFLESISSNTKGKQSHLNCPIIFDDFMSYPISDILEIMCIEIPFFTY